MGEESSALARIVNLLMLTVCSVLFVAALADPRIIPMPQGAMSWLFWFGGPSALAMTALCGWMEW